MKKMPLNYAILKYYTTVDKASVQDVMKALKADYGDYKPFKQAPMLEAIMTAESNALLTEDSYGLNEAGELEVFYRADEGQRKTILGYIG